MGFHRYLAMTAAEAAGAAAPEGWAMAWMACHFSPYATGLSNLPESLPPGAMLILNDRTPMAGHDPERIKQQLLECWERLGFEALLLDFQRPGSPEAAALCAVLGAGMPFPVGVSQLYGAETQGPVFLDPVPPDRSVEAHLAPWQDRELWLDLAAEAVCLEITESGCRREALGQVPCVENALEDPRLCCRYRAQVLEKAIRFHIWRDPASLEVLAKKAADMGVTRSVGLFQELGRGEC